MEQNEVVFSGIFKGRNIEEVERLFFEKMNVSLKEFLSQKYLDEGISTKQLAVMFGCSYGTMYLKLKRYNIVRSVSESRRNFILSQNKNDRSRYNKTPTDIEIETGEKFVDIVKRYLNEGYAPSEIARDLKLANQSNIRKVLKGMEYENQELIYPNIFGNNRKLEQSEKLFIDKFGINLREFLYQKYVLEKCSTHEIAPLFGVSPSTILSKVKAYGFGRDLKQARKLSIDKGDINYIKIINKSKKTARKSSSKSNNQEFVRDEFKYQFSSILDDEKFNHIEVIVGYDDWSILKGKEVDIPIIVINNLTNEFFKFAVEFNGNHHSLEERKKDDEAKEQSLISQGWYFYTIWDSPYHSVMEENVIKVVDSIIEKLDI